MPIDDKNKPTNFDILNGLYEDDLYRTPADISKLFQPTIKKKRPLKFSRPKTKSTIPFQPHIKKVPPRETVVSLGQKRKHLIQAIKTTSDPTIKAKLHKDYFETTEKIEKKLENL